MEKWKEWWRKLVRWPGWTAWLHWSGWKRLAHWQGWKAFGAWSGWQKILYPHPVLVVALAVFCGVGLVWTFATGHDASMFAYPLYCASFYALVTLTALLVKAVPQLKKRIDTDPLAQKIKEKEEKEGAFGIGMYWEQFLNFFYGVYKIAAGVYLGSAWIGADGIYNFVQALIQLYQILRHKQVKTMKQQWKSYRWCGFMMIALHTTMGGMVFQMIHMGRHEDATEIGIIATAAFTFFKLIKALVEVAKDRRHKNPVDSAVYFLDFSQALYNLFVLQVGLLWVFGGSGFAQAKLMNSLTGGAVCLLVCGMGVYMVWRANRDMKALEETELG